MNRYYLGGRWVVLESHFLFHEKYLNFQYFYLVLDSISFHDDRNKNSGNLGELNMILDNEWATQVIGFRTHGHTFPNL